MKFALAQGLGTLGLMYTVFSYIFARDCFQDVNS
jgi:hypothetical protein